MRNKQTNSKGYSVCREISACWTAALPVYNRPTRHRLIKCIS